MDVYKFLCICRIIVVLLPQTGYIHPDEHFQGPEIVYGDIAQYDVLRAWEFTSSKPIRSITFPYIITGIPAIFIYLFKHFYYKPSAYLLLLLPRLIMCLVSFLQDFCIYKLCKIINKNYKPSLILFASSYVTLVYMTRTFSNSLESLYFIFLILILFEILKLHKIFDSKTYLFFKKYVFFSFIFGITLSVGCFNRPTFICFSIFPIMIWCYTSLKLDIHIKYNAFIAFLFGVMSMCVCLIIIDTLYYNKINYSTIYSINNIVCTPLNFVMYNLSSKNLDNHGLHSRWLHILVNVPLLFTFYGIILPVYHLKSFFYGMRHPFNIENILLICYYIPLILLSLIPHQEPRFIIPLIIPLSLLFKSFFLKNYRLVFNFWIISNILCLIFYGFIHQSGVYLSMQYISSQISKNNSVIFYKTYMPPWYLLSFENDKNINIFDFTRYEETEFKTKSQNIVNKIKPFRFFMVLPNNVLVPNTTFDNLPAIKYKIIKIIHIFPHLSTENLPKFTDVRKILRNKVSYLSKMHDLKAVFSIQIIIFENT